jgi:hypothetical protein
MCSTLACDCGETEGLPSDFGTKIGVVIILKNVLLYRFLEEVLVDNSK